MKQIPLRRRDGSIRAVAIVDDDDFELVSDRRWKLNGGYASRTTYVDGEYGSQQMHRVIMGVDHLPYTEVEVDHRDGDGLNNRKGNLRLCSHAQNGQNRRSLGGSSSRFRGMTLHRPGKWKAQTRLDGRNRYLGVFDTEEEAAAAVLRARKGMFA